MCPLPLRMVKEDLRSGDSYWLNNVNNINIMIIFLLKEYNPDYKRWILSWISSTPSCWIYQRHAAKPDKSLTSGILIILGSLWLDVLSFWLWLFNKRIWFFLIICKPPGLISETKELNSQASNKHDALISSNASCLCCLSSWNTHSNGYCSSKCTKTLGLLISPSCKQWALGSCW